MFIVLRWPVGLYLLSYVVQSAGFLLHGYFVEARMVPNLRRKIAVDATNLLLGKSYRFYQDQFSGAIANRVNDLGRATPDIIEMLFDRLFSHALAFGIALFFLWSVSPYFAVFTITWAGLFFCVLCTHISLWIITLCSQGC